MSREVADEAVEIFSGEGDDPGGREGRVVDRQANLGFGERDPSFQGPAFFDKLPNEFAHRHGTGCTENPVL